MKNKSPTRIYLRRAKGVPAINVSYRLDIYVYSPPHKK
jgi:hypothetical protein